MNVLILYTEVSGYLLASAAALAREQRCNVHIVRWPVAAEAPFEVGDYPGVTLHDRGQFDVAGLVKLYRELRPPVVYVSGWLDKGYVAAAREMKSAGTPVICGCDNHWRGTLRQRLATLVARWSLHRSFTHFWAPGVYQYEFGRRLHFAKDRILTGMYSADVQPFHAAYERSLVARKSAYPKTFLFVGRYIEAKGLSELVTAFTRLCQHDEHHDWRLKLVGAGPLRDTLPRHERIEYADFVQPKQLPQLAEQAGCFVLPSRSEPWGVALHEFAAAGLPIVTSDNCGAATQFVRHGYNGWVHRAGDSASLQSALRQIAAAESADLRKMGRRSFELSQSITPELWAATLMSAARGTS